MRRARVLAVLGAVGLVFCEGIRRDELDCEESTARLVRCCPGFEPRSLSCAAENGCGSTIDLAESEARCVQARSCEQLQTGGTCDRAIARWTLGTTYGSDDLPVCR